MTEDAQPTSEITLEFQQRLRVQGPDQALDWLLRQPKVRELPVLLDRLCPGQGEDLAQETLIRAMDSVRRYRGGDVIAWLYGIGVNLARKRWSSAERRRSLFAKWRGWLFSTPAPDKFVERNQSLMTIRTWLDDLPAVDRLVFELDQLDLTQQEIAAIIGTSPSTAGRRIRQILGSLERAVR